MERPKHPIPITCHAPAERASALEITRQSSFFDDKPLLKQILDAVPSILMILNRQRQIIFTNKTLLAKLGLNTSPLAVLGHRPGEAVNCSHADETPGGCGTTESCTTCGAVNSILESQKTNAPSIKECRIIRKPTGDAMDLRVWAVPLDVEGDQLTIFSINDISDEKRRRALERIFFHDILNTAGSIKAFTELMNPDEGPDECLTTIDTIRRLATRLTDEIIAQRTLSSAENDELTVRPEPLRSLPLLGEVISQFELQEVGRSFRITLAADARDFLFISDLTMVRRILVNMIKNAVEASAPNDSVTVGCNFIEDEVHFWVHNVAVIPREVQLQIFQRSFSTKGVGRGLGTYGMKLLAERYLGARVSFTSAEGAGTTFRVIFPLTQEKWNPLTPAS